MVSSLSSSLSTLAGVESEAIAVGGEGDDTALGEVEYVTRNGLGKGKRVSGMDMYCHECGIACRCHMLLLGSPLDLHGQSGQSRR